MDCGSSPYTVDTQTPGWEKTLGKVLEKIPGVTFSIDANHGLAHVSGYIDAVKTLKLLKKAGKHAQVYSIDSGTKNTAVEKRDPYPHRYDDHDPQGRYWQPNHQTAVEKRDPYHHYYDHDPHSQGRYWHRTQQSAVEKRDHYYHHYNDPQGSYWQANNHHQFYGQPAPRALPPPPPQYLPLPPTQPTPTAPYYYGSDQEPQCTIM
ncbi:hypothetical protein COLO4_09771 [Corchorus olitorius]|uniref:HMA domain-containing protein n=1 Tax=Corchorus olitorius TaxID=93759 RepID=A0A1R3KB38_9ROSI|nr:hypothetical protein COLO4_09771 [Corchorus olitorius]